MTDFWIVCTDRTTHASRELAKLRWRGDDADPEIWDPMLADPTLSPDDVLEVRAWDSVDVTGSRSARRGGAVQCSVVIERSVTHAEGALWRFRCPTCRRDKPLRDKGLRAQLAKYGAAGLSRIDISHLR